MMTETETGGRQPQAKELWVSLGATCSWTGRKYPSLEPLEGEKPCPYLDFRLTYSRTVSKYISLRQSSLWLFCYISHKKLIEEKKFLKTWQLRGHPGDTVIVQQSLIREDAGG